MSEYNEFIGSEDWSAIRDNIIRERGSECERCHKECSKWEVRLHHTHYEHELGFEDEDSLMVVCLDCHNNLHADSEAMINE